MSWNKKGVYANYLGAQPEKDIFGGKSTSCDAKAAAASARQLLNLLKTTCDKCIMVGRNGALDEASVACGRHVIVYSPSKPAGKNRFILRGSYTKDDNCARGDMRQAASMELKMVAAAWCDGINSIVYMVSNADASTSRFSIATGHSYKRWSKKLALI
ncbi:hypothetical protein PInf_005039 [Phytophthora infestans]|nr:hypothetical protein PInf_005039 [Phytophthora infestans]